MKKIYLYLFCFLLISCSHTPISDKLVDLLNINNVDEFENKVSLLSMDFPYLRTNDFRVKVGKFEGKNISLREYGFDGLGTTSFGIIKDRGVIKFSNEENLLIFETSHLVEETRKNFRESGFKFLENNNDCDIYDKENYTLYIYKDYSDIFEIGYTVFQLERNPILNK